MSHTLPLRSVPVPGAHHPRSYMPDLFTNTDCWTLGLHVHNTTVCLQIVTSPTCPSGAGVRGVLRTVTAVFWWEWTMTFHNQSSADHVPILCFCVFLTVPLRYCSATRGGSSQRSRGGAQATADPDRAPGPLQDRPRERENGSHFSSVSVGFCLSLSRTVEGEGLTMLSYIHISLFNYLSLSGLF